MINNFYLKLVISCLFVFDVSHGYSQIPLTIEAERLINQIERENRLLGEAIGISGKPTQQYKRFTKLKSILTDDQFHSLLDHENSVVKCYAIWALSDNEDDRIFEALMKNLRDTNTVISQFGCVIDRVSVSDFSIDLLTKRFLTTADYYRENQSQITDRQKEVLDSTVLYDGIKINYFRELLLDYENVSLPYELLHKYLKAGYYEATPLIAKFQKQEDLPIIMSLTVFKDSVNMHPNPMDILFKSIDCFPDKYFENYLVNYGNDSKQDDHFSRAWKSYYTAILNYNSEFYMTIIEPIFDEAVNVPMRKYHLDFLSKALNYHASIDNHSMITRLFKEYGYIEDKTFNIIATIDTDLADSIAFEFYDNYRKSFSFENRLDLLKSITNYLSIRHPEYINKVFRLAINSESFEKFNEYLYASKGIDDTQIEGFILQWISKTSNPDHILYSVSYLLDSKVDNAKAKAIREFENNEMFHDKYFGSYILKEIEKMK